MKPMELGQLTYVNLFDDKSWNGKRKAAGAAQKSLITKDPSKFLALKTKIMEKLCGEPKSGNGSKATAGTHT